MAAQYPTNNQPFPMYNDEQDRRPNVVYIEPYPNQEEVPERIDSAMERTAQYVSGLNPNGNSHSSDNHGRSSRHVHTLPSLTIRRHTPGSNDPSLQRFPVNLQQSENITPPTNVHVTIRRNPTATEKTVIQPVFYPVHVYVPSPVPPQYPTYLPNPSMNEVPKPALPMPIAHTPPPALPAQYETRLIHTKSLQNQNRLTRPPVHEELLTPPIPRTPSPTFDERRRIHSSELVIEEYDDYDEYYRVPSAYAAPKKVISYRTVPGMTTREIENEQLDERGNNIYVTSPKDQTVTYRVS